MLSAATWVRGGCRDVQNPTCWEALDLVRGPAGLGDRAAAGAGATRL